MRVGVIGRTEILLKTAEGLLNSGYEIAFLATAAAVGYSTANEDTYEEFAHSHGIPFINDARIGRHRDELFADVCVSMNWPSLIPQSILEHFPLGVINAHAGDLPRYRGNATLNWAILNGEERAWLSFHRMVPALDAGPIVLKVSRPIEQDTDITELFLWLSEAIPAGFLELMQRFDSGDAVFTDQPRDQTPVRVFPRRPEDSRIDWTASNDTVLRLIRASSHPFEGAYATDDRGRRIPIFRARRYEPGYEFFAIPGQVCLVLDGNPVIATADGMIELLESSDAATLVEVGSSLRNRLH